MSYGTTAKFFSVLGSVFAAIYFSGYRYIKYSTEAHGEIVFVGKVDGSGKPAEGKVYYADGRTAEYNGEEKKLTYSNGESYVGELSSFLCHGKGSYYFTNGDIYNGDFVYDEMTGNGSYKYSLGDSYVGGFVNGKKEGIGKYIWMPNSDNSYDSFEGSYKNDLRNGQGVYIWADGSRYEGNYVNDVKSGQGSITYANGDSYVGTF